jgi:hypothetical protein
MTAFGRWSDTPRGPRASAGGLKRFSAKERRIAAYWINFRPVLGSSSPKEGERTKDGKLRFKRNSPPSLLGYHYQVKADQ